CLSVGYYTNSQAGTYSTMALQFTGHGWLDTGSINAPGSSENFLQAVSTADGSKWIAVGEAFNGNGVAQTLAEIYDPTANTWSLVPSANTAVTQGNLLYSVSCPTT